MAIYHNLGFDDACDILGERKHRMESQIVERSGDMEFEPVSHDDDDQQTVFGACVLGQHLTIAPAARGKLLRDLGLKDCADALPQTMLVEALNHVIASRLRQVGNVKIWHDSEGRLIHVDWAYRQRANMDSVGVFRTAFHSISMNNQHTIRRPGVLVLADLPTHVDVTADCDKVREVMPFDTLLGGVMLRHSEIGATPTSLFATIFRSFCLNVFKYGVNKSATRYVGDMRIPVGMNDLAGGLASGLGGLLNRMRRLAYQPCLATDEAMPLIQCRWDLSQVTADSLLEMTNDPFVGKHPEEEQGCLYDVLNTFTAVTTHRREKIPQGDCGVLERLSDSLLTGDSPLQRLLQQDLRINI